MALPTQSAAHHHAHHHAASDDAAGLAQAAQSTLEAAGEKWTATRSAIFDAVASQSQPASAYDIAEDVSRRLGRRIAPNTVYRILDLFVTNNLVRRVESANAFIANSHPGCVHDCIFLICDSCGQTTHVDDDTVASHVRAAARVGGFAPSRPVIEVRGTCADCD